MFKICSLIQPGADEEQDWALQVVTSQIRNPPAFSFKRPVSRRSKGALEKDKLGDVNKDYIRRRKERGNYCSLKTPDRKKEKKIFHDLKEKGETLCGIIHVCFSSPPSDQ